MKRQSYGLAMLHLAKRVALIDLVLWSIVGLFGWYNGWQTPHAFGSGMVFIGIAAIVVGVLSLMGGTSVAGDPTFMWVQSGSDDLHGSTRQLFTDLAGTNNFLVLMTAVGGVSIALGELIKTLFP